MNRGAAVTLGVAALVAACASGRPPERAGMAYVPAGAFAMGSDAEETDDHPRHPVVLRAFLIDRHEVTNAEYERVDPAHRRDPRTPCDECPVTGVGWGEAERYCESQRPPKRLPTEAEWEKAAKGGRDREPEPLRDHAWIEENAVPGTQPVMLKLPNGYGLYDMLGNAAEWVADWYDPRYYEQQVLDDPAGPPGGTRRARWVFLPSRGQRDDDDPLRVHPGHPRSLPRFPLRHGRAIGGPVYQGADCGRNDGGCRGSPSADSGGFHGRLDPRPPHASPDSGESRAALGDPRRPTTSPSTESIRCFTSTVP